VSLTLLILALAAVLAVLLFAVSLFLQSYFYNAPADRLPLRALVGGLLAAAFLGLWLHINTRAESKDKYSTLFEFNSTAIKQFDQFTAIRRHQGKDAEGKPIETTAKITKAVSGTYVENKDTAKPFKLTTADYLVTAIEIPDGEGKVRLDAELFVPIEGKPGESRAWRAGDTAAPTYSREAVRTFRELGGRRFVEFSTLGTPGPLQVPSRSGFLGALLINLLHFAVWFIVFWPILRFTSGTALGLALAMTVTVMLFVMPVLFNRYQAPPAPPVAVAMTVPT